MKLSKFSSYDEYVRIQMRTERRKSRRPALRRVEVSEISEWIRKEGLEIKTGICHGCRYGQEIDWFSEEFPAADVLGTDLFQKNHPKSVQHDFHDVREDWIGRFDFVYSNSLDHSHDPWAATKVWKNQLNSTGIMLVQWTPWHLGINGGDCFAADLPEYVKLINRVIRVRLIMSHNPKIYTIIAKS